MNKKHSNVAILTELMQNNEMARKNITTDLTKQYHEKCASCVRALMSENSGVVSNNFVYLEELGEGKPGDSTCEITFEYAKALIAEEKSINILTVLDAEEIERDIEEHQG